MVCIWHDGLVVEERMYGIGVAVREGFGREEDLGWPENSSWLDHRGGSAPWHSESLIIDWNMRGQITYD